MSNNAFPCRNGIEDTPVLLAGDFNSPQEDPVYDYVQKSEFKSSYREFHGREPGVTHRDHNGRDMAVDYIFYRCCTLIQFVFYV